MERVVKAMSKYTTELRFICESYADIESSEGYNSVEQIIALARPKLFDFPYEIFDEEYRTILETKIIRHFYIFPLFLRVSFFRRKNSLLR